MKNETIKNGIDFHIIEAEKFKTNRISVFFRIPLERKTITSATLLPAVLKRGSEKYPTLKDISRRLDDLYSASFIIGAKIIGNEMCINFSSEYISDKYSGEKLTKEICDLFYNIIFKPYLENNGFKQSYLDGEKINCKNLIEGLINDKKEYAEAKCKEIMFGENGYGMSEYGYVEDLDSITASGLYDFYINILNTAKVDIFISGTVDKESIEIVKSNLADKFNQRESSFNELDLAEYPSEIKNVTEDADTVQSKLCMGLICGVVPNSDEYYALTLANCIFGGSPFSKLFNNVREKLSLAYYASARVIRFKSFMIISSGIQTENFKAAYDEIILQFNKMQKGEIEDSEVSAAKKYLANIFSSLSDSLYGMEHYWLSQTILGLSEDINQMIDKIAAVSKEEVIAVMNKVKLDTVYFLKGKSEEAKI